MAKNLPKQVTALATWIEIKHPNFIKNGKFAKVRADYCKINEGNEYFVYSLSPFHHDIYDSEYLKFYTSSKTYSEPIYDILSNYENFKAEFDPYHITGFVEYIIKKDNDIYYGVRIDDRPTIVVIHYLFLRYLTTDDVDLVHSLNSGPLDRKFFQPLNDKKRPGLPSGAWNQD
jgi:hypothetical protein